MSIITPNIDASPYTGIRNVKGKVRVKTHNDAPWLDNFFNGKENCDQITSPEEKHMTLLASKDLAT